MVSTVFWIDRTTNRIIWLLYCPLDAQTNQLASCLTNLSSGRPTIIMMIADPKPMLFCFRLPAGYGISVYGKVSEHSFTTQFAPYMYRSYRCSRMDSISWCTARYRRISRRYDAKYLLSDCCFHSKVLDYWTCWIVLGLSLFKQQKSKIM